MEFTNEQKLITAMLAEVHQALKIKDGIDSKLVSDAIWSGNEWAISWEVQLPDMERRESPDHVKHVADVLDMWSFIEDSYAALNAADKQKIADQTHYKTSAPSFHGFDGNNECDEYSAAKFLINKMGRWSKFAGRDLNSHSPTVERSGRMLRVFLPIRDSKASLHSALLTADELIAVLTA